MDKDKEVKKNVKNTVLSMCDVKVFLTRALEEHTVHTPLVAPIM
jgi:hypothetical protein